MFKFKSNIIIIIICMSNICHGSNNIQYKIYYITVYLETYSIMYFLKLGIYSIIRACTCACDSISSKAYVAVTLI